MDDGHEAEYRPARPGQTLPDWPVTAPCQVDWALLSVESAVATVLWLRPE
jgi:hypothetical protein